MMKKKRGQPAKDSSSRKQINMGFKVTKLEHEKILEKAILQGVPVAQMLRSMALK